MSAMKPLFATVPAGLLALAATALAAEAPAVAPPPALPASAADKADAPVQHLVSEDDHVRIEETRFRGVTQSIVVKSKVRGGGMTYEIRPPTAARDPSQPAQATAGQRVWSIPLPSNP